MTLDTIFHSKKLENKKAMKNGKDGKNDKSTPKGQLVEALKSSENILITVSANPSVDELSAALGLSLLLDKLDKHATAVFSGKIPSAISFLNPEKTFEDTTNSLQDFIIALDKEKADHLRYKVDGDLVKIFITPYRTVIGSDDLQFSQGDYNVETVVTIGAQSIDDLDHALADHGRIMHDATVASISIGGLNSQIGSINLSEPGASSYCEVVSGFAEDLRESKSLLDEQIATAFLTGIVAATERFSNEKTTAEVMTLAAQLMAAGANQQLIAVQLGEARGDDDDSNDNSDNSGSDTPPDGGEDNSGGDGGADTSGSESPVEENPAATPADGEISADGTMSINHQGDLPRGDVDTVAEAVAEQRQEDAASQAEAELANVEATNADTAAEKELSDHLEAITPVVQPEVIPVDEAANPTSRQLAEPSFGGTLNATTEAAAEQTRLEEEDDRNRTILSHGHAYVNQPPASRIGGSSFASQDVDEGEPQSVDIFSDNSQQAATQPQTDGYIVGRNEDSTPVGEAPQPPQLQSQPLHPTAPNYPVMTPEVGTDAVAEQAARDNLNSLFQEAPQQPAPAPVPNGLDFSAQLPPLPDFSTLPPLSSPSAAPQQPASFPPQAPNPFQMADPNMGQPAPFSAPIQQQPEVSNVAPGAMVDSLLPQLPQSGTSPVVNQSADPGQFQIPGQS